MYADNQGSILLKAAAEDDSMVYKLSNTEFTMYKVGIYKNNSWVLAAEFAKSGDNTDIILWLSLMGVSMVIFSICKRNTGR